MPQIFKLVTVVFLTLFISSNVLAQQSYNQTAATSAGKNRIQNWVKVNSGNEFYFDFIYPQQNKPIVVLLNGLTATTQNWEVLAQSLATKGIGVLRFDFYGQGKTLAKYGVPKAAIGFRQQAEDVKSLLQQLNIPQPYNFVGHSYGGGITQAFVEKYPQLIKNMILMAPYTRPVDSQDLWIKSQVMATKMIFPFNKMDSEQLYDYYLKTFIYSSYPYAEPSILKVPNKLESTFRLVQGIRRYLPEELAAKLPAGRVHLMLGAHDTLVLPYVMDTFWRKANPKAKMSRIFLQSTSHYINDVAPKFSAAWVAQIVMGNGMMFRGSDFIGYPWLGYAQIINGPKISLDKE